MGNRFSSAGAALAPFRGIKRVVVPPVPCDPVGGRLQNFYRQWKKLTSDRWVLKTIRTGLTLDLVSSPVLNEPFDSATSLRNRPEDFGQLQKTLDSFVAKEIVEEVAETDTEGIYAAFFGVAKKDTTDLRGCWDGRRLNEHIAYEHFKMEGISTVRDLVQPKDWLTKIDISDAYPHIAIPPKLRHLFRFVWNGKTFQYRSMCFGLSSAPRVWTRIMKPIVNLLRQLGIRCVIYLDDLLLLNSSPQEAREVTQMVLNLLEYLGLMVKPSKVEAVPTQRIEVLGMMIDTVRMLFTVPEHKVSNLRKTVRQTIDKSFLGQLTKRQLAGVIGKVTAMAGAVHPARLHTWPLIHELNLYRRDRWDKRLPPLSPECLSELRWWQLQLCDWNGRSVIPVPHSWTVTTDAAKTGWGGWWRHIDRPVHPHDQARGFFSQKESRNSSNWRELSGVLFTLQAAVNDLNGQSVLVETDNSTTVAYVNHMGGRYPMLNSLAQQLWGFCLQHNIRVVAVHRAGVDNERADMLSRIKYDPTNYRLLPSVFQMLDQRWGRHSIDLFADRLNTQLPRYVSRFSDPLASGVDVFRQDLTRENGFAHPPPALISRFASFCRRQGASATVITPNWSGPWLPQLMAMATDRPLHIPYEPDLLVQGFPGAKHRIYNFQSGLLAWRICGRR